eukprot:GILI01020309.1.p1 GENE.GILI01020309.1~~GILI01020309.1.p1  ORF type:complete len:354 (-),score=32.14 GILI01020309.1:188-1249(-)
MQNNEADSSALKREKENDALEAAPQDAPSKKVCRYDVHAKANSTPLEMVPTLVTMAQSQNQEDVIQAAMLLRKLASTRSKGGTTIKTIIIAKGPAALAQLTNHSSIDVVSDALWALSHICDSDHGESEELIQPVIKTGVVPKVVELLSSPHACIQIPAMRIIGNICSGSDQHTLVVLKAGFLQQIKQLGITDPILTENLRKDAVWALSNIAASGVEHIRYIVEADLVPILVDIMRLDGDPEIRNHAVWGCGNLVSEGSARQVKYFVESCGGLEAFFQVLSEGYSEQPLSSILEGIASILRKGTELGDTASFVERVRSVDGISILQNVLKSDSSEGFEDIKIFAETALSICREQ